MFPLIASALIGFEFVKVFHGILSYQAVRVKNFKTFICMTLLHYEALMPGTFANTLLHTHHDTRNEKLHYGSLEDIVLPMRKFSHGTLPSNIALPLSTFAHSTLTLNIALPASTHNRVSILLPK